VPAGRREFTLDKQRILGDKEPGEPALLITLSDRGGCQRRPALACPDDRDLT
jgi:hypothetical protein